MGTKRRQPVIKHDCTLILLSCLQLLQDLSVIEIIFLLLPQFNVSQELLLLFGRVINIEQYFILALQIPLQVLLDVLDEIGINIRQHVLGVFFDLVSLVREVISAIKILFSDQICFVKSLIVVIFKSQEHFLYRSFIFNYRRFQFLFKLLDHCFKNLFLMWLLFRVWFKNLELLSD